MTTRRDFISRSLVGAAITAASTATSVMARTQTGRDAPTQNQPPLKIIGLEEHIVLPSLQAAWSRVPGINLSRALGFGDSKDARKLRDFGEQRLADMDSQGINMQVLASTSPGVQNLPANFAVDAARAFNNELAEVVRGRPASFQGFATLPTQNPRAAAAELERAVQQLGFCGAMLYGRTGEVKPEDRRFDELYATASRLRVPLYFHPQVIVEPVRQAYYTGVNDQFDRVFATAGLGWYYDLGVQILRMIFTGVFDRHPRLQIIIGHWGEVVLFFLDHIGYLQQSVEIDRPLMDYFRQNIWITGSGTQSPRYIRWAAEVVGTERMLYATDYPFTFQSGDPYIETSSGRGRSLLVDAPFTQKQKAAIGSDNWRRLIAPVTNAFG